MPEAVPSPIMNWDEQVPSRDDCVWWNRLDGRYQIEVQRVDEYHGLFLMWDRDNDMKLLSQQPVGLSYQALFGPDVADVGLWESMAIDIADGKTGTTEQMTAPVTKEDGQ